MPQCPTCGETKAIIRSVHELPTPDGDPQRTMVQALCKTCGTGYESKVQPPPPVDPNAKKNADGVVPELDLDE